MPRLGELLVSAGVLTAEQVEQALRAQVMWGGRLGTNLVELHHLELDALSKVLGRQHQLPAALARHFEKAEPELQRQLSPDFAERFSCLPLLRIGPEQHVVIASVAPLSPRQLAIVADELAVDPARLVPAIAAELRIRYQLERVYNLRRAARYLRARGKTIPPFPRFEILPVAVEPELDPGEPPPRTLPVSTRELAEYRLPDVQAVAPARPPVPAVPVSVPSDRGAADRHARAVESAADVAAAIDAALESASELELDPLIPPPAPDGAGSGHELDIWITPEPEPGPTARPVTGPITGRSPARNLPRFAPEPDPQPAIDPRQRAAQALGYTPPAYDNEDDGAIPIDITTEPTDTTPDEPPDATPDELSRQATLEAIPAGPLEDEASARQRRTYVRTIADAPGEPDRPAPLGRIAIRKVAAGSAPRLMAGATVGEATRAIRRGSGRDRVADLVVDALERFTPACDAAILLVIRGATAIGWKGFQRAGGALGEIAVPIEDGGLVPEVVERNLTLRKPCGELAAIDRLLLGSLGRQTGDLIVAPIAIGDQVMCVIALATADAAEVQAVEPIAEAAGAAFARLMRDASR